MNPNFKGYKFLVVEDDEAMLEVLSDLLKMSGAEVFTAQNGEVGLEIVRNQQLHLVISDVQMPVMDGVSLLKEVRKIDPKLPLFLLVTGQAEVKETDVIALGALGILRKPFQRKVFLEQIASAIRDI